MRYHVRDKSFVYIPEWSTSSSYFKSHSLIKSEKDMSKSYKYPTNHLCILVLAPFWHFICINFPLWCRFCSFRCYLEQIYIEFCYNSASKLKRFMPKHHLQMILFKTNLVSNISTKAKKHNIYCLIRTFSIVTYIIFKLHLWKDDPPNIWHSDIVEYIY